MGDIDHRAEAARLLEVAYGTEDAADALVFTTAAQVHATLAAGTPVADEHVREALRAARAELDELRAAVREHLIARSTPPYMDEVTSARLRALIVGA